MSEIKTPTLLDEPKARTLQDVQRELGQATYDLGQVEFDLYAISRVRDERRAKIETLRDEALQLKQKIEAEIAQRLSGSPGSSGKGGAAA